MDELSEAVFLYLGFGPGYKTPKKSPDVVIQRFGPERGQELIAAAQSIVSEMNDFPLPEYVRSDDPDDTYSRWLGLTYKAHVEERHPELHPEAVRALSTSYAWWWMW